MLTFRQKILSKDKLKANVHILWHPTEVVDSLSDIGNTLLLKVSTKQDYRSSMVPNFVTWRHVSSMRKSQFINRESVMFLSSTSGNTSFWSLLLVVLEYFSCFD